MRRRLFGWEIQQWSNFLASLKGFVVCDFFKDLFVWKGYPSGRYSVNLYCKSVLRPSIMDKQFWKCVWMGCAPPKVEVFCWQLMRGRIATKDQLLKKGLLDGNLDICTFCKADSESIGHLFFLYAFSWQIWMHWCFI